MTLDGVLRHHDTPIREGRMLFDSLLNSGERVVILSDDNEERTEDWLVQYSYKGWSGILTPQVKLTDDDPLRERQIAVARALGRLDMVIDSDPKIIEHCLEIEVPGMLFAHPRSMRPSFRPDGARRTWAEIETQLTQRKLKEHRDGDSL